MRISMWCRVCLIRPPTKEDYPYCSEECEQNDQRKGKKMRRKTKLAQLVEKAQEQIKTQKEVKAIKLLVRKLQEIEELNKSLKIATQQLNDLLDTDLEEIDVDVF